MGEPSMSVLDAWCEVPNEIERFMRGLAPNQLDLRRDDKALTPRETVHHIVEANLVAANMIIAALGTDEYEFDWMWLWPNAEWTARLGYGSAEVEPAMRLLRALTEHLAGLLRRDPALLQRKLGLRDSGDAEPYKITIEGIIAREVEHAHEHLGELQ